MNSVESTPSERSWPWWRKVLLVLALVVVAGAAWARPGATVHHEWSTGASVALANVFAAFFLVVGLPFRAVASGRGPVARALGGLLHPLVAAPVNCLAYIGIFATGLVDRAAGSAAGWVLLVLVMTLLGAYADLAVLRPGVLRSVTPGLQVLFAAVCGVIDEFPGIAAMVMHRHADGVAMWIIAQPVIFPALGLLVVQWLRHDQARAREEDARLDALDAAGGTGTPW